jgi:hypothetical protein
MFSHTVVIGLFVAVCALFEAWQAWQAWRRRV